MIKTKIIPFKDLKVGMKIKSFDEKLNQDVFKRITDVFDTEVPEKDQVRLEFKNGVVLECSVNHPIMVLDLDKGLIEVLPEDLTFEMICVEEDGGLTQLSGIQVGGNNPTKYMDITVEDTHTFYAYSPNSKGAKKVLVHNSQGALRGAAATFNYPMWHLEWDKLIELKNNKGVEETRLRTVDYSVHLNRVMYERLVKGGDITFFSPDEVPDMYEAFYSNTDEFRRLYEKYEADPTKTKLSKPAREVFAKLMQERFDTGRIYIMNADHANDHGSFVQKEDPVRQSNLCMEITLPTKPMGEEDSQIALCTLSAVNMGKVETFEEIIEVTDMAVRGLDELLDYQNFPNEAAERSTKMFRPLGVGVIGFAHFLAKRYLTWGSEEAQKAVSEYMQDFSYGLINSSAELAKEKGALTRPTKYSKGILPFDTYTAEELKAVNVEIVDKDRWEELRTKLKSTGIRNATLMALMPSESSSQLSNETNGIEPPRDLLTVKGDKNGVSTQVVPEYYKLGHAYETVWNVEPERYLKTVAVFQKFVDQAISSNTSYNPHKYEVTTSRLVKDLLLAYKLGIKTLYYNNTLDEAAPEEESDCEGGACKI